MILQYKIAFWTSMVDKKLSVSHNIRCHNSLRLYQPLDQTLPPTGEVRRRWTSCCIPTTTPSTPLSAPTTTTPTTSAKFGFPSQSATTNRRSRDDEDDDVGVAAAPPRRDQARISAKVQRRRHFDPPFRHLPAFKHESSIFRSFIQPCM